MLLLLFVPCAAFAAASPPAAAPETASLDTLLSGKRFSASCPYGEGLDPESAKDIAAAAARYKAVAFAARLVAELPETRLAKEGSGNKRIDIEALTESGLRTKVLLAHTSRRENTVTATVAIIRPAGAPPMESAIRETLTEAEPFQLFSLAVTRLRNVLSQYESITSGTAHPNREGMERLRAVRGELLGLGVYMAKLRSGEFDGVWKNPAAIRNDMRRALENAPQNPLLENAAGDASLLLGRSQEAMEAQTRAIAADPSFARAYHSRGLAYLTLRLPSLAEADFSRAIALMPENPLHYRDRGMARLVLEEIAGMCSDFYAACTYGDCQKFHWAVTEQKCAPQRPERASPAPQTPR